MKSVAGVTAAGFLIASQVAAAPTVETNQPVVITVRTYDYIGVVPQDMARAQAEAGAILQAAGIETRWLTCWFIDRAAAPVSIECGQAPTPNGLLLRLVQSPAALSAREASHVTHVRAVQRSPETVVLGYSFVDFRVGSGSLSTVYPDRITTMAETSGIDPGTHLGRVMAHEIGHLLLGTREHARQGLMRARWSQPELHRHASEDWLFSDGDALRMRHGIRTRDLGVDGHVSGSR